MIELINDDCLKAMPGLKDKSIDLILTDPPYGRTENKWDQAVDMGAVWQEWNRIIKDNGAILVFADIKFAVSVISENKKLFRYEWVVEKGNATGFLNARRMPLKAHDIVLTFYKHLPTYNPQFEQGNPYQHKRSGSRSSKNYREFNLRWTTNSPDGKRFPRDVIKYKNGHNGHPTGKPADLMAYFIKTYTNKGDTVLDCFMGSGSTGAAAIQTHRNFIGIEREQKYFALAKSNIERVKHDLSNQA